MCSHICVHVCVQCVSLCPRCAYVRVTENQSVAQKVVGQGTTNQSSFVLVVRRMQQQKYIKCNVQGKQVQKFPYQSFHVRLIQMGSLHLLVMPVPRAQHWRGCTQFKRPRKPQSHPQSAVNSSMKTCLPASTTAVYQRQLCAAMGSERQRQTGGHFAFLRYCHSCCRKKHLAHVPRRCDTDEVLTSIVLKSS